MQNKKSRNRQCTNIENKYAYKKTPQKIKPLLITAMRLFQLECKSHKFLLNACSAEL